MLALALLAIVSGGLQPPAPPPPRVEYEVVYHHAVRNTTDRELRDVVVYLPVPQSDAYQQVEDFRVERSVPVRISNRTDEFGTKIKRVAIESLPPRGEAEVGFSCTVRLAPPAKVALNTSKPADLDSIPKGIRDTYTRDHRIFGLQTPIIRDAAAKLLKEHPNPVKRAHAIHDLIASTFSYRSGEGWDAAPDVLQRRSGSCSEFSYVFGALCRATGIPTRFVGASICPREPGDAFQDRGHHRWAEAYLTGHGWVPFDATLDRRKPAKQDFVGSHHGRTLIVTRTGDKSLQLGLSYLGSNNHGGEVSRSMSFTWSQGTGATLAEAIKLRESGKRTEADAMLRALVEKSPGTRAASEASRLLSKPRRRANAPTRSRRPMTSPRPTTHRANRASARRTQTPAASPTAWCASRSPNRRA